MAASYVAGAQAGDGQSAIVSSLTVTLPAASVGDYAIVSIFGNKPSAAITAPSGWTLLSGPDPLGMFEAAWLYGKTLATGEPGSATSWTFDTAGRWLAVCGAATGVDTSSVAVAMNYNATGSTKPQLPSLGGVTVGSLLFEVVHGAENGGAVLTVTSPPTSYTGSVSASTNYGNSPSLVSQVGYKVASSTGGFGGESGTFSSYSTWVTYLVAVAPAASSASASASGGITLGGRASVTAAATASGGITLGGSATGTITVPNSPGAAALPQTIPVDVRLFASDYTPLWRVPDYVSCSVTWQRLGIGTGTLVIEETDPAAPLILSADTTVVPVRVKVAGQTWTGRVVTAQMDLSQPPGARQITATLADDWAWLSAMLASQGGSSSVLTGMPQYDTQTGPVATVAAYYINAAAARLGVPVAASPPTSDQTPTVTLNARMQTLADLLTSPLDTAGCIMPTTLWLPGDAQPPGLLANLTRPTVVFWPQGPSSKPWLRWSDTVGSIIGGSLTVNHTKASRVMLGLSGTDAARVYDEYTDTGLQASLGAYGFPESYSDATDVSAAGADSQARGAQAQKANAGTASVSVTVQDGAPWTFGTDYVCGDVATVKIGTVSVQESITRVTASDDRQNGLVFTPLVGDPSAQATSDELIVRAVSDIAVQLRLLQTGS